MFNPFFLKEFSKPNQYFIMFDSVTICSTISAKCCLSQSEKGKFLLRPLEQKDKEEVRRIYHDAQASRIFTAFLFGIGKTHLVLPALLVLKAMAILFSLTDITVWLLGVLTFAMYLSYHHRFMQHIGTSLESDLADPYQFYMSTKDESNFWVIETEGKVVAFVGAKQQDSFTVELQRLSVVAEFRRKGLGEWLCRHLIAHYKEKNYRRVELELTEAHKQAKQLYSKLGFCFVNKFTSPFALSDITLEKHCLILSTQNTNGYHRWK